MVRSDGFSKSAAKVSLLISAIAGSVLVASVFTAPPSFESQARQLDMPLTEAETSEGHLSAVLATTVVSGAALYLGVNAIIDRKRSPSAPGSAATLSRPPSQSVTLNRASRTLQRQLLVLLHEDQATAHRLFTQASLRYPGETPNWYVEKVIYDLERDRGAR